MESPLRYLSSDECSSAWLKFHLGLPNQSTQRSIKRPNHPQQQRNHQQQQQQHLNTLGLRLNAAGKIKPSVVNMPSMEHRWKIHYSYKTKALTRSINTDDAVMVGPPVSQRNTRDWSRSESGKRSPQDAGRERSSRVRSAASVAAVLARGREQQRSPRNREGTPELVTMTPIRLLGVLRSPEHAPLNWRGNDGQQHQPPRYFVFPPVTGSGPGASTPLVRRERRVQVSTAPVEARSRSGLEREDLPMTFTRSASSESLPSSWKYAADGRQTTGSEVTDDRTPRHASQSTETTLALPTIDEEDAAAAAASEASHRISVRISRNNSFNNRYNNNWNNNNDKRLGESDELRIRVDDNVDEDNASDSLSVYDDDSEEGDVGGEAEWPREPKPSSPVLAIAQVDDEGINGDQNEDHIGDQNEDLIGDQNEDHNVDQNEDHTGDQNEDQIVDQSEDHNGNQNEDHIGDQNEDHIGDQNKGHNEDQHTDQSRDLNSNSNCYLNELLSRNEKKTDSRKCCENDYQEIETTWTKEVPEFSPTQRAVYPPLTSRGRASESPPPIPRDIPTVNESQTAIDTMHITGKQHDSSMKELSALRQVEEAGVLVGDWKGVGTSEIASPEESYERREQDVSDKHDEGKSNRGRQQREESDEIECRSLKDETDENNNIYDIPDRNEVKKVDGVTRGTSNDTETTGIEADSAKVVEIDSPESLAGKYVDGEESNESETETVEPLKSPATELTHVTHESQSDPESKVHPLTSSGLSLLDDQQQNGASLDEVTDEKLDESSVESASLESTIASREERRSPPTGKAVARKRSVRFSQDALATVYLYMPVTPTPDDSDTSDSGFLSP